MNERTEELLNTNNSKKPKKKTTLYIIIGLIALAVVGVLIYLIFSQSKDKEFKQNFELGQKYLDEGNYDQAIIAFNDAIELTENKGKLEEANLGLSSAAAFNNDIEEAKKAYEALYELTDNENYLDQINNLNYGNSDSNTMNRGNTASRGNKIFYINQNDTKNPEIYSLYKGEGEKVKILDDLGNQKVSGASAKNLNVWGNKLYLIYGPDIISVDILSGNTKTILSAHDFINKFDITDRQESEVDYFQIYDNTIYFLINSSDKEGGGVFGFCNIDGSNPDILNKSNPAQQRYIISFFVTEESYYIFNSDSDNVKPLITKFNEDGSSVKLYEGDLNSRILTAALYENNLYFNLLNLDNNNPNNASFGNEIFVSDVSTGAYRVLFSPGSVSAVNAQNDTLYYVSNGVLNSSDLNGENIKSIGSVPSVANNNSIIPKNIITISDGRGFVTTSISNDPFIIYGDHAETNTFLLDNPSDYQNINSLLGITIPESSEEEEVVETSENSDAWKQAYIDYINSSANNEKANENTKYELVYLNDDAIPELLINYDSIAAGSTLITFSESGGIDTLDIWNYGLSYIDHGNKFVDYSGQTDMYEDTIYTIENGKFKVLGKGEYSLENGTFMDDYVEGYERPYNRAYTYYWNGTNVSVEDYIKAFTSNFDINNSIEPDFNQEVSKDQIIKEIESA